MGLATLDMLYRDRLGLKRLNPGSFGVNVNTALISLIFVAILGLPLTPRDLYARVHPKNA